LRAAALLGALAATPAKHARREVRELAAEERCTPGQLSIAWVLARGNDIVPIPGTKRRKCLEENVGAEQVQLTREELERIDSELPRAAGDRYDRAGMSTLNR
jgi:aryl-alcohol dehydrogenase-like predicted oxidoreductase